jgi:hypothetical protein
MFRSRLRWHPRIVIGACEKRCCSVGIEWVSRAGIAEGRADHTRDQRVAIAVCVVEHAELAPVGVIAASFADPWRRGVMPTTTIRFA